MNIFCTVTLVALISPCCTEVYDWNVRTVETQQHNDAGTTGAESDTDFGDELKLRSALNSELQRDLWKISGKANANDNVDNVYYDNLRKFKYDTLKDKYSAVAENEKNMEYGKTYQLKEQKLYGGYATSSAENIDRVEHLDQYKHNIVKVNVDNEDDDDKQYVKQDNIQDGHDMRQQSDEKTSNNKDHDDRQPNHMDYPSNYNKYQLSDKYKIDDHKDLINNDSDHSHSVNRYNEESHKHSEHLDNEENYIKWDPHKGLNQQYHNDQYASLDDNKQYVTNYDKNINNDNYQLMGRCPEEGPDIENFLGTNLFGNTPKKCFSAEDIQLIIVRKDFESLLPKDLPQCLLNDRMIAVLMNYFNVCHQLITTMTMDDSRDLTQKAFYDTLGGYLNFYLVPVAKYSYYADLASLGTVQNILRLQQQCKNFLNTNGNGWKAPMKDVLNDLKMVRIEPLHVEADNAKKDETLNEPLSCAPLDLDTDHNETDDEKMIAPLPKLQSEDDNGQLGNVWLPFRRKRTFDLKSPACAYVIVKFYETLSKCYRFENINQDYYNRKLKEWLLENVIIHLSDDVFYPGLGAVLRILESLRRTRKKEAFGDHLWEADYEDDGVEETREKKSYPSSSDRKSKEFLDILKESKDYQEKPKTWLKQNYGKGNEDATHFLKVNNKLRNEAESENNQNLKIAKLANPGKKHQEQLTEDQINQAAAIIEEREKADASANAKTQWRFLEMTPLQLIIVVIPVVVLISIIIVCCLKFKKNKKKKHVKLREYGGGKKRSKNGEETQLLNAQSKSVVHGNSYKSMNRYKSNHPKSNAGSTGSSSSSLMCQFPAKCFTIKRSGPAIIETTSLDYSSSEAEDTNIKKPPAKAVKIDEKSEKTASLNGRDSGAATKGKDKKSKDIPKSNV